ncbi:piggyBac transposable element-derived protein 4-like [Cydia pomonella]|uniref:piggyBac transposable element-derived protein 4-like n=1 Tax=Cydia pomonella TaxID=82600 RepID=UPI002ADDF290|nr:piggyBac transposable element-derived protein 4-like [Cydia pomonella]
MDKKKHKIFMKVFESSSSRESSADPYEDDGEFGSDKDYDPVDEQHNSSDSSVSVFAETSRNKNNTSKPQNVSKVQEDSVTSESDDSDNYEEVSSSSESIFEIRKRKNSSRKSVRSRSRARKQHLQLPRRNSSVDTDTADTISIDSIHNYILDTFETSSLPDPVAMENIHASPQPDLEIEGNAVQLVQHATLSPNRLEMEDNLRSHASPPPVAIDGNVSPPAIPPPDPVELERDPSPHELQPPDLVEMEGNPSQHAPPSPDRPNAAPPQVLEQIEGNPPPNGSPPPDPEEIERRLSSTLSSPPGPEEIEFNPSSIASLPLILEGINGNMSSHGPPTPERVQIEENPTPLPNVTGNEGNLPGTSTLPDSRGVRSDPSPDAPSTSPLSTHVPRNRTRSNPSTSRRGPRCRTPPRDDVWESTTAEIPTFDFDTISAGVQFDLGPNATVKDVFDKLFPTHIVDFIVARTNEYGRALCATNRPTTRNSRRYRYKDTDRKEIQEFLGLCLLMGHINVPKKRKLFTYSDPLYYHPIFGYIMSGRRFEQILRCLCVSELNAPGKEKIVRFIDAITKNFRDCYKPTKELSLDESLLLFRGRLSFRQYIKSKKARYGIKFYELTTSDGFVLNISMYAGNDEEVEKGKKTEKIVMRLMDPYLLKGHHLYMDNYYNSSTLSQKLLDLETHTTGTLRSNRKDNPKEITQKKLKKNQHVWTRKNNVYVSKWVDKRPVLMITTCNHPKLIEVSNRFGVSSMKPEEVSQYNQFMSGIDRADQMVAYYSSPRKTLRWYRKVFFHVLDLAVWNSFFIYRKYCKNNSKKYEFVTYREDLIRQLINLTPNLKPEMLMKRNKYDNRLKERTEFVASVSTENTGNLSHWPEKIPVRANSKKTSNYMKCRMCTKKKIRRETCLRCKGCEEKPALCAICFEEWHHQS